MTLTRHNVISSKIATLEPLERLAEIAQATCVYTSALDLRHHLSDDLTILKVLVSYALKLLSHLFELLLCFSMFLSLSFHLLRKKLLLAIKSSLLGSYLPVEHVHPVHLLVLDV